MRSGSSLLLHILLTNPGITGQGERNRAYTRPGDLAVFAIKANLAHRDRLFRASLSVDQVNHTHFLPNEELLLDPHVLPVILFREPRAAIGSMMQTFNRFREFRLEEGIGHYRERVTTLTRYANMLFNARDTLALTYDQLVEQSEQSFANLQAYLRLEEPLSGNYASYDFTGRRGDPSDRIRAGKILPGRNDHGVDIDAQTLAEMQAIYRECLAACGIAES